MMRAMLLPMLLVIAGCGGTSTLNTGEAVVAASARDVQLEIVGTIKYIELEGGFFGIVGDDGARYDPVNLAAAYAIDGLRVKVQIRPRPDSIGFHMWGEIVEIIHIENL